MPEPVCIDASLALALLLPDNQMQKVEALWTSWIAGDVEIVTAPLFFAEVTSVLRESVFFGRITADEGDKSFDTFIRLDIKSVDPAGLQAAAWSLAKAHNRSRAYDAQYLAVAASLGCDLWTADRRLVNAVHLPWLRWVGDYEPSSQ